MSVCIEVTNEHFDILWCPVCPDEVNAFLQLLKAESLALAVRWLAVPPNRLKNPPQRSFASGA
jgi:hypothetical protein